jgi:hypothetical protein
MIGYLALCLMEVGTDPPITIVLGRAERDIWRSWVPHLSGGGPKMFGFSDQKLEEPRELVKRHLNERFKALGLLPRFGKRIRLNVLATNYADAGLLLRFWQTSVISDEAIANSPINTMAATWPYDAYATGPE